MSKESLKPEAIGSPPGAFKITLDFLKDKGISKVLDCPAGEGPFSQMLFNNGYDVVSSDVYPEQFKAKEIKCDFVDLNETLPYDDNQFDAVTCLNGLQRVWARGQAVKEFSRIVKPGGYVVISFPNNSDLRRRLMFMLTGSVTWNVIGPPSVCVPDVENPASSFRYPMTIANVLSAMESVDLECVKTASTHYSKSSILLSPLAIGPKLFSLVAPEKYSNIFDKNLFKLKQSSTLDSLLGAFLVVIAQKKS